MRTKPIAAPAAPITTLTARMSECFGTATSEAVNAITSNPDHPFWEATKRHLYPWNNIGNDIHFTVVSNGCRDNTLKGRLAGNVRLYWERVEPYFLSKQYKPTKGRSYHCVLKAEPLSASEMQVAGLVAPHPEVAVLAGEYFVKEMERMGLWRIFVMHDEIPSLNIPGRVCLLSIHRDQNLDTGFLDGRHVHKGNAFLYVKGK